MEKWLVPAGMACLMAAGACLAAGANGLEGGLNGDAAVREAKRAAAQAHAQAPAAPSVTPVVVPAMMVVPAVVIPLVGPAVPAAPAAPAAEAKPDEPPPPPEPPEADAAEPRRLVRYFCKAWKDRDYERMWWAMSPQYRKNVSLEKFSKLFESDAEMNGGLKDENILEEGETGNGNKGVKTELVFKFPRARHRIVAAEAERQPGGAFRIVESPIVPLDLDDL